MLASEFGQAAADEIEDLITLAQVATVSASPSFRLVAIVKLRSFVDAFNTHLLEDVSIDPMNP